MLNRHLALSVTLTMLSAFATGQASWHRLYPTVSPAPRLDHLLTCFESTGQCIMLYGRDNTGWVFNEAWNWTGTTWALSAAAIPSPRYGSAVVWDAARQRLVLFGGSVPNGSPMQDLWEFDGTQWAARTPAASPPARESHGMAFDRVRGVVVMYGGNLLSGGQGDDTWTWNGSLWQQQSPAQRPAARFGPAMAFDAVGGGVLLYGGNVSSIGWTDETWFWDGANWHMRTPTTPPYLRQTPGMVTDLYRNRIVLYGGAAQDSATWQWDGTEWSSQQLPGPGPRESMTMAYDPTRRQTLFFGGHNVLGYHNDTWAHFTPSPALAESYGTGCAGSNGVPALAADPLNPPWIGDTFTTRATNLAPAAGGVAFATGFQSTAPISLAPFGMPGCDQLMMPATTVFRLAAGGTADWSLSIPNTTSLANVHLFQQAFALDPTANVLGLTASNGVAITIDIR